MKISFIGSGNVAWHMAQALENANHHILEVYSPTKKNADKLCRKLYNASAVSSVDFSASKSELIIIAVPDDAIELVANQLKVAENTIVVHTSGSKSLEALALTQAKTGVFYPVQTFSKGKTINFRPIPICIEAIDEKVEKTLQKLAFTICENVCFFNSEDRKVLHISAVFACNFTNYLMTISKKILESEGLDFAILKPLIQETMEKALLNGPEKSQTGPASREDSITIKTHLAYLVKYPQFRNLYELLTEGIIKI